MNAGSSESEELLWAAVTRLQDADAFAKLFDLHRDRVYRHAFFHLENTADAEDALATAFLELWRGRRKVQLLEGSILPWLLGITTNTARNLARSRRRYRAMLDRLPREVDPHEDAEARAISRLESVRSLRAVAAELKDVPAQDAALLTLTSFEGYSTETAAAVVGISASAARTRLHRLRRRLRAAAAVETTEATP